MGEIQQFLMNAAGNMVPPGITGISPTVNALPSVEDPAGPGTVWNAMDPSAPLPTRTSNPTLMSNTPVNTVYSVAPWTEGKNYERYLREGQCIFIARQTRTASTSTWTRLDQLQTIASLDQLNAIIKEQWTLAMARLQKSPTIMAKLKEWPEERIRHYVGNPNAIATLEDNSDRILIQQVSQAPFRYLFPVTIAEHWNFGGIIRADNQDPTRPSSGRNQYVNITVTTGKNVFASNVWGPVPISCKVYLVLRRKTPRNDEMFTCPYITTWFENERQSGDVPVTERCYLDHTDRLAFGHRWCVGTADADGTRRDSTEERRNVAINIGGRVGCDNALAALTEVGTIQICVGC